MLGAWHLLVFACSTTALADTTPVPFDDALAAIVSRSTELAIQGTRLESARARKVPATLAFAPSLRVTAKTGTSNVDGVSRTARGLEGESDLNLFRFGGDWAAVQAADHDVAAEAEQLEQARLAAEEAGVAALVAKIQRVLEIRVLDRIASAQEENLRIAKQRYDRSFLPRQEVEKVSVDLDNARARAADARIRDYEAEAQLTAALGHAHIAFAWPWTERVRSLSEQPTPPFELSQRPDWRADSRRFEAEDRRYSRSRALFLPSLDATLSAGTWTGFLTPGVDPNAWTPAYTGFIALNIPLFDRLSNYSAARAQFQTRTAAEQQLEQTRRNAVADWESASRGFKTAATAALARERTLELSRKLYQDNLNRFHGGKASANELIVDQNRLADSELFAIQGWAAAHLAYSRLCHAQGRMIAQCR